MQLGQRFNVNDLPQNDTPSGAIPAGDYNVTIERAEVCATRSGDGQYIKLMLRVNGPTCANACLFSNLNIVNANATAENIGKKDLRSIMESIGLQTLDDTDQMIGGQMTVKVVCVPDQYKRDNGEADAMKNEVKAYKKSGGAPQQFQSFQSLASQQTTQQQAPQPQTPPASRPW